MQFFKPDKNLKLIKYYHKSTKFLLPFAFLSYIGHQYDFKIKKHIDCLNVINISYHSYVSTSSVITDYIKINRLQLASRIINFKSHSIATIGFFMYILNNFK